MDGSAVCIAINHDNHVDCLCANMQTGTVSNVAWHVITVDSVCLF